MAPSRLKPLRLGELALGLIEYLRASGEANAKTCHAQSNSKP